MLKDRIAIATGASAGPRFEISESESGPGGSAAGESQEVIINVASKLATSRQKADPIYSTTKTRAVAIPTRIALEYTDKSILGYKPSLDDTSTEATSCSKPQTERKKRAIENTIISLGDPREAATITATMAREAVAFASSNMMIRHSAVVLL